MGKRKTMKLRIFAVMMSLVMLSGILPPAEVLAAVLSPYTSVETTEEGVTIYSNKDGSKTAVIEIREEDIVTMESLDESDRLVEEGDTLVGEDEEVSVRIRQTLTEDSILVSLEKEDYGVSFSPVAAIAGTAPEESESSVTAVEGTAEGTVAESTSAEESTPTEESTPMEESTLAEESTPAEETTPAEEGIPAEETMAAEETGPVRDTEETSPAIEADPQTVPTVESIPSAGETTTQTESAESLSIHGQKIGYSGGSYEAVQYESVFDENTGIRLAALKTGIKEDIILDAYTGGHVFSYTMHFKNLTPRQDGQRILLIDENGEEQGVIAAPYMLDAADAYSEDIAVTLTAQGNDTYQLTYAPSDSWLSSDERSYPVVIDPSISYTSSRQQEIEDNYVTVELPDTSHNYNGATLKVGNDGSQTHIAYVRPALPESLKSVGSEVIIQDASARIYEKSGNRSSQTFSMRLVTGGEWSSRLITYASAPAYSSYSYASQTVNGSGWYTWDMKQLFSEWFNTLDQKGNYGFALVADENRTGDVRNFASADDPNYGMTFSVTYYELASSERDTDLSVSTHGNGINSGTGYANLNWNAIPGAEAYYLAVFNGNDYEYFNVGNVTSYSTQGKGIWPTTAEIASGRYQLHHDGGGTELPMIPAFTYANAGSTGTPKGASFYLDKTGPTAPAITLTPSSWTNGNSVSLTWSGINDLNPLDRVEYSIDGGAYISTGLTNDAYSGYTLDISALFSGTHTLQLRGVDIVGNVGTDNSTVIYKDVLAPDISSLQVDPSSWTNEDTVTFTWKDFSDQHSGTKEITYALEGEAPTVLATANADDAFVLDVSNLADGEHKVQFTFYDQLDNQRTEIRSFYRDISAPEIEIISPSDGDLVAGSMEILGSVKDISLKTWSLYARGSSGKFVTIYSDTAAKDAELLGILNTDRFEHGESIEITLEAEDQAGNRSLVSGIVIKVDKSAKPVAEDVRITSPVNGSSIRSASETGSYEIRQEEQNSYVYIDSLYQGAANNKTFPFDAITYEEYSMHSIAVISEDTNGVLHYSKGLYTTRILADTFEDETLTQSKENITYTALGATLTGGTQGNIVSTVPASPKNILALRLTTTQNTPAGTSIEYFYSLDAGATWQSIFPGQDRIVVTPVKEVLLTAVLKGDGVNKPVLYGWDLESVIELSGVKVLARLLQDAHAFTITEAARIREANHTVSTDRALPIIKSKAVFNMRTL